MRFKLSTRAGFTIVELLVVIAIIAVLAAILFPIFARAKESGLRATALVQAKQLGTALTMYNDQHDGKYLPSTNYGMPESEPNRMWQNGLYGLVKDKKIFSAPGSDGKFAETWEDRGLMSIGYSSATAVDKSKGCPDDQKDTTGCLAFTTVAEFSKEDNPSATGLFAVTPNGPTNNNYRGYEFSPYNGAPNTENAKYSGPLASDRDLVKESPDMAADLLKPIYCRYMSTGKEEGFSPVIFADGHAKDYSAASITDGGSKILWRFR